jgi:hypothetical protein
VSYSGKSLSVCILPDEKIESYDETHRLKRCQILDYKSSRDSIERTAINHMETYIGAIWAMSESRASGDSNTAVVLCKGPLSIETHCTFASEDLIGLP